MTRKLGWLCLGTMGYPMAGHLARSGFDLRVYNRTRSVAEAWVSEYGGELASTPAEAVRGADCAFACTGNDQDLLGILLGPDGALPALKRGACFVDHTSTSARTARQLAEEATRRGIDFLDAPVSGGEAGAIEGALTIMVGGEEPVFARAEALLARYAKKVCWMGPSGSGQLTKMVNQICIAGLLQALAEGLHFARRAGLDAPRAIDVISQGAAQSWQMDHRARTMLDGRYDFGFAVDWMRKDLANTLEEARRTGATLPVTALVDRFYAALQDQGAGRLDTSSLLTLLETRP